MSKLIGLGRVVFACPLFFGRKPSGNRHENRVEFSGRVHHSLVSSVEIGTKGAVAILTSRSGIRRYGSHNLEVYWALAMGADNC